MTVPPAMQIQSKERQKRGEPHVPVRWSPPQVLSEGSNSASEIEQQYTGEGADRHLFRAR